MDDRYLISRPLFGVTIHDVLVLDMGFEPIWLEAQGF